jgi:hypothetical protein
MRGSTTALLNPVDLHRAAAGAADETENCHAQRRATLHYFQGAALLSVLGRDGQLYGVTSGAGIVPGTLFRMTTAGAADVARR